MKKHLLISLLCIAFSACKAQTLPTKYSTTDQWLGLIYNNTGGGSVTCCATTQLHTSTYTVPDTSSHLLLPARTSRRYFRITGDANNTGGTGQIFLGYGQPPTNTAQPINGNCLIGNEAFTISDIITTQQIYIIDKSGNANVYYITEGY